jgi:hypothetical protein
MSHEKNTIINYAGKQIAMYSDERNDYVSLTDMINASKTKKSILTWLKLKATIEFMGAWERKYNPKFNYTGFDYLLDAVKGKNFSLSVQLWIEKTNSTGIFSRSGGLGGTYAHKDIALKFASYISPELELYIIEEIQRLKNVELQRNSLALLTHQQILDLIRLKEVFKYVTHQEIIEDAHKEVFAARSGAKNPFAAFYKWRNEMLGLEPETIDSRIREYCVAKNIPLTSQILRKSKREKILFYDSYESVKNAVFDFLQINGEIDAKNLAELVSNILRVEGGEVVRENKGDFFHTKQDLGQFNDLTKLIAQIPIVGVSRQVLKDRETSKTTLESRRKKLGAGTTMKQIGNGDDSVV